jgi:four helix bundle protein
MRTHKKLEAWQSSRQVSLLVLEVSRRYWKPWASAVFDQLQRASTSVQFNISEGSSFGRSPTYARHLAIAFGSATETIDAIELLIDGKVVGAEIGDQLLKQAQQTQRLLVGLLKIHRPFKQNQP